MKKLLIALTAFSLVLTACQKEASFEDPNAVPGTGGGGTGGGGTGSTPLGLLIRSVQATSTDSSVTDFGYDASKRLLTYNYTSTAGDFTIMRFTRNSSGIVTQYSYKDDGLATYGIDSIITFVNYSSAQSRYTSSVYSYTISGVTYRDSAAYSYDGSGNLVSNAKFEKAGPSPYVTTGRTDYTYASGNVATEKYYAVDTTGTLVFEGTATYSYDAKANPLILGAEALVTLEDATYFGANNITVLDFVDPSSSSNNIRLTSTYTYNTSNKPTGGSATVTPVGGTYSLRYYYN